MFSNCLGIYIVDFFEDKNDNILKYRSSDHYVYRFEITKYRDMMQPTIVDKIIIFSRKPETRLERHVVQAVIRLIDNAQDDSKRLNSYNLAW